MFDFSTMPSWLGGTPAAPAAPAQPGFGGMQMEGGWQMPQMTGGAKAGYAAPGATGAMNPGAPFNYAGLASGLLGFANQLAQKHQAQNQPPPPMQPMQMMQQPHYTPGVNPYATVGQPQPFGGAARPFWGG